VNKAVFLDRDGVINYPVVRDGKPYPPLDESEIRIMPGVVDGLMLLKQNGCLLIITTNQPDVGRGTMQKETVEAIHEKLMRELPLDDIKVSYDAGRGEQISKRRKPAPGMLLEAAAEKEIDLNKSWMIGDRWRDVDCGAAAGCRTIFIDYGYAETLKTPPDYVVQNFEGAVKIILQTK
jgi:D-glycero-D-manno-heptose 1,7-bisphosphate phosphatase